MRDVFRKELMDMVRDRRVRTSAFVIPIVLIFMMLWLFGIVFGTLGKPKGTEIHFVGGPGTVQTALQKAGFKLLPVRSESAARGILRAGGATVVVVAGAPANGVTPVKILYDAGEQRSGIARAAVEGAVDRVNAAAVASYLKEAGVPDQRVRPLKITPENVAVQKSPPGSEFLVGFLPYLIVLWAFQGGASIAADQVAGEKEKQTLETLLISPVSRTQIVVGKIAALALVCLASALSSVVGLILYAVVKPRGSDALLQGGLGVTPEGIGLTVVLLIPLVVLFASLLVLTSSYARNVREAQTYLALGSFLVLMPGIFSQFIGFTDYARAAWVNFVPVLNTANNLRLALAGRPDLNGIAVTLLSGLLLAAIATLAAIRLFRKEEVLGRS